MPYMDTYCENKCCKIVQLPYNIKYKKSLTTNYLDEFEIPYNDVSELLKQVNQILEKLKGIK